MTKRDAEILLREFFSSFGKDVAAFAGGNFVKAGIGESVLGFEYRAHEKRLACYALIYQFRRAPKIEILAGVEQEERAGADTGGGEIVFDRDNNALSLVRVYDKFVDPDVFAKQMRKLAAASLLWSGAFLDCAAARALGE